MLTESYAKPRRSTSERNGQPHPYRSGAVGRTPKVNGPVKAMLHDLFVKRLPAPVIVRVVDQAFQVTISDSLVNMYRQRWGYGRATRQHEALTVSDLQKFRRAATRTATREAKQQLKDTPPCDLCGDPKPGPRWLGSVWRIEGKICDQCRNELTTEAQQRDAAAARERARDEAARRSLARLAAIDAAHKAEARVIVVRAAAVRACSGHASLPILTDNFTSFDLRGRALTHWLKTVLRSGRGPRALMREDGDGLLTAS